MKTIITSILSALFLLMLQGSYLTAAEQADDATKNNDSKTNKKGSDMVLQHTMKTLDGKDVRLDQQYKGKVVLIVNVASKCGLTPHYKGLQSLYTELKDKGFAIAGFPCNQFGKQEPGTAEEIKTFCQKNYGVTFDMYSKVDVNGDKACDLYKALTAVDAQPAGAGKISWNFEKFLVGKDGQVLARFGPRTEPNDKALLAAIEKALKAD